MAKFLTFPKGGVHPNDSKAFSKGSAIVRFPMPEELVVSLSQHLGAPAKAIKNVGDVVKKGELIAEASSFISAHVHSPVTGTITDIKKVTLPNSVCCDAFVIKPQESEYEPTFEEERNWEELSGAELLSIIKENGVVGMGGATFPVSVKLSVPVDKKVEYLVLNGVECEPFLTADYRLMLEKPENVILGAMICAKVVNPQKIIIGVEANKLDCVDKLREEIQKKGYPIEVQPLKMKYPQGDEKQLLKAVTGREIPSGKLPLDIGCIVVNVGTSNAIYEAVKYQKPLIERIVTITGPCIKNPMNVIAPIGTKIKDLIEFAGGFTNEPDKLVSGGPMMGFSFFDLESPVCKGTSGILALKEDKKVRKTGCISCGKCILACPIGLQPTKMYRLIENGMYQEAMATDLMDCKECGCCSYSCPAHLPLVQTFRMGKRLGRKK